MMNNNPNDHVGVGLSFDFFVIENDKPTDQVTRWPYQSGFDLETAARRFALAALDHSLPLSALGTITVSAKEPGGYFRRFTFRFDWAVTPILVEAEP